MFSVRLMFFVTPSDEEGLQARAPKSRVYRLHITITHEACHHTMLRSNTCVGGLVSSRSHPNIERSRLVYLPSKTSSETARPAAGDCWSPCPEKPLQMSRLGRPGIAPIKAFWSRVEYSYSPAHQLLSLISWKAGTLAANVGHITPIYYISVMK